MEVMCNSNGDIVIINSTGQAIVLSPREAKRLYDTLCEKYNKADEISS